MSKYSGYGSWKAMMARCNDPSDKDYAAYGGRGVLVCERWHDVRNFAADMGDKVRGQSIDRINPDGHYCPENCEWATALGQGGHKRNNAMINIDGCDMYISDACRKFGIKESTLRNRLIAGMSATDAVKKGVRIRDRTVTVGRVTLTIAEWAQRTGLKAHTIRYRIRHGVPPAEAVTRPTLG